MIGGLAVAGPLAALGLTACGSHPFVSHDVHRHARGAFGPFTTNGEDGGG